MGGALPRSAYRPMNKTFLSITSLAFLVTLGCSSGDDICAFNDIDCDGVPDDLGRAYGTGGPSKWDYNRDGVLDGYAVIRNGGTQPDALGFDTTGDGKVDSVDINLDGKIDETTPYGTYGKPVVAATGGASSGTGGEPATATGGGPATATGGGPATATGGGPATATGGTDLGTGGAVVPTVKTCLDSSANHSGGMNTTDQYGTTDVQRNGQGYRIIYNGWGPNFGSQHLSAVGTRLKVESFSGSRGSNGEPAGYPSVYMGNYSETGSSPGSPFPISVSQADSVVTGMRWYTPTGNASYNVAWDIWLSNGGGLSSYFMVWLRDPPGEYPAGKKREEGFTIPGIEGRWNIYVGEVLGHPIINYVRPEGEDSMELSFKLGTFFDDAIAKGYSLGGTQIMSVAVGFEIWDGSVSNLGIEDFCVRID
jgi:hypothetical protein